MTQTAVPTTADLLGGATRRDVEVGPARYAVYSAGEAAPTGAAATSTSPTRSAPIGTAPTGTAPTGTTPVVLLHGVPETSACWRGLMPALATDRAVHAVDLKGLGDSSIGGPYDVRTVAAEIALVAETLSGGSRVDLVGHDWGGTLAAVVAASRPDLVRRLVVVSGAYRKLSYLHAPHVPFFALPAAPELLFRVRGETLIDDLFRVAWRRGELEPEVLAHYRAAYADPERLDAMLSWYRTTVRGRASGTMRSARRRAAAVPSKVTAAVGRRGEMFSAATAKAGNAEPGIHCERHLVVWGGADPVMPISVGEAVCREMRDPFTMITMPGVGHWPLEEDPAYAVPAIAEFLRDS